ncbi:helicase associated domain-containing protein [Streptomyces sp. NPDC001809]
MFGGTERTGNDPTRRAPRGWKRRPRRLGAWISNQRSRAATLSPERVELLSAIGMRWS